MNQGVVTKVQHDNKGVRIDWQFEEARYEFWRKIIWFDMTSIETISIKSVCCLGSYPINANYLVISNLGNFQSLTIFLQIKKTPRFVTMADWADISILPTSNTKTFWIKYSKGSQMDTRAWMRSELGN